MSSSDSACSWNAALLTRTSSRPKLAHHLLDRPLAELAVLHVAGNDHAASTFGFDVLLGVPGVVMLVEIDDADVGAFAGEEDRHRAPDARVAAGHDRRHPLELAAALVVGREEARRERQVGFPAGLRRGAARADGRVAHAPRPAPRDRRTCRPCARLRGCARPARAGWRGASRRSRWPRARRGSWPWSWHVPLRGGAPGREQVAVPRRPKKNGGEALRRPFAEPA